MVTLGEAREIARELSTPRLPIQVYFNAKANEMKFVFFELALDRTHTAFLSVNMTFDRMAKRVNEERLRY